MENKINVAELLKDCPRGMELDCVMFNNVTLWEVEEGAQFPISIRVGIDDTYILTEYGEWNDGDINAKCVIFPKGKTTWEGFIPPCKLKDGDIVATDATNGDYVQLFIFKKYTNAKAGRAHCYLMLDSEGLYSEGDYYVARHATEEEKAKLVQAIKDNGYKWNAETKTLEKLIKPKFKVGDRIKTKTSSHHYFVAEIRDNCYLAIYNHGEYPYLIPFVDEKYYELVTNKFDISTLKPYKSEVLHRNTLEGYWKPAFWGAYIPENSVEYGSYKFLTTYGFVRYCIPFENNEHLIGTQTDCSEYYKIWKE